jgi:ProP effector
VIGPSGDRAAVNGHTVNAGQRRNAAIYSGSQRSQQEERRPFAEAATPRPSRTMTPEERQKREAAIRILAERWPKCFAVDEKRRRPLKVGIADEVHALLPDIDLSTALALYARSTSYMKALVADAVRIGLDGEPAGTVSAVHEAFARRELAKRETKQPAVPRRPILPLPSLRPKTKS